MRIGYQGRHALTCPRARRAAYDLAARLDRPKGWSSRKPLPRTSRSRTSVIASTLKALADVDAGRTLEHAEVEAWAARAAKPKNPAGVSVGASLDEQGSLRSRPPVRVSSPGESAGRWPGGAPARRRSEADPAHRVSGSLRESSRREVRQRARRGLRDPLRVDGSRRGRAQRLFQYAGRPLTSDYRAGGATAASTWPLRANPAATSPTPFILDEFSPEAPPASRPRGVPIDLFDHHGPPSITRTPGLVCANLPRLLLRRRDLEFLFHEQLERGRPGRARTSCARLACAR